MGEIVQFPRAGWLRGRVRPVKWAKAGLSILTFKRQSAASVDGLARTLRATPDQLKALQKRFAK